MGSRRTTGEKIFSIFNIIFLTLLSLVFILPVWHVLMASISDPDILQANSGLALRPWGQPTFGGYQFVLSNKNIIRAYGNTIVYVVGATAFSMFITILAAYGLSRKDLYFRKPLLFLLTFTMIFSGGLIPTYMVVKGVGMIDTMWALIIPGTVSVYNIIVMRTSFSTIPDGLLEAAKIDGAGHLRILLQVVLPVSKAVLAVIVMFYAIRNWNAWFNASIYLQKRRDLFPLQLSLREIILQTSNNSLVTESSDPGAIDRYRPLVKYSTIMISVLPMLVVYPFIQKYFVSGVMIGSIKG
ncbi:MAG: carbohydrate ABC transporter permease [Oscillospiraceae bacterium]|nr:carbohydrate ABC transporter permease [Oscillospiraceae bacterium]